MVTFLWQFYNVAPPLPISFQTSHEGYLMIDWDLLSGPLEVCYLGQFLSLPLAS